MSSNGDGAECLVFHRFLFSYIHSCAVYGYISALCTNKDFSFIYGYVCMVDRDIFRFNIVSN